MIVLMIACDGCGLEEQTTTQHDAGVNEIDGVLEDGWHHGSSEDYCPKCAKEEGLA